jgi:hypothetical protein
VPNEILSRLNPVESDCERPPEPGFARREAHCGEENNRPPERSAGSGSAPTHHHDRKEGAHGGNEGFPRANRANLSSVTRALSFLAVGAVLLFGGFLVQRLGERRDVPAG